MEMKRLYILGLLLWLVVGVSAQGLRDSLQTFYKVGSSHIDTLYMRNGESMSSFFQRNLARYNHPDFELEKVVVIGSSSPDGRLENNEKLALQRAHALAAYIKNRLPVEDRQMEIISVGVDWRTLTELVAEAKDMPNQGEVLDVLRKGYFHAERLQRLKELNDGLPYRWMGKHLFSQLRQSQVVVFYQVKEKPAPQLVPQEEPVVEEVENIVVVEESPMPEAVLEKQPFYWALKTNGLYDLALIPNIGVEVYAGRQWSVVANGMFAWWKKGVDRRWCVYGADMAVRRWFGRKADAKPLTGHHVGVYAQALTYDFCLDDKGYMGGEPEGSILDKMNYAFGLEYGYSLPVARRLNLDFVLGLGYWGGTYHEYRVIDDCKVWQASKNRHWFGPTKAEVSLVWLLGSSKSNKEGGTR